MKKKILIVGGTGVISFAVVNESIRQGFDVTCINRGKSKNQILSCDVNVIIADYRNSQIIKEKLGDNVYDVIVDVLCYTEKDIEYSVELFKDHCKQYIFFSSCAVYNKGKGDYECTEDSELVNPIWQYSIDKVACERKLIELASKYNLTYTIVRPAVTYGDTRIPYGITPPYGFHGTIIMRILNHKPIIIWDGGNAYSTITRVEDFAVGLVGLFGNPKAYNQSFHIVGDERYKWKDVIKKLGDILGEEPVFFDMSKEDYASEIPNRAGELLGGRGINQLLDNSKLKEAVPHFKTTITLSDGLKKTVEYYKTHNYIKGVDYKFDADTDRIIAKWAKKKGIATEKMNLRFVNYLGNASKRDKLTYWLEFHKENFFMKRVLKMSRFIFRLFSITNQKLINTIFVKKM